MNTIQVIGVWGSGKSTLINDLSGTKVNLLTYRSFDDKKIAKIFLASSVVFSSIELLLVFLIFLGCYFNTLRSGLPCSEYVSIFKACCRATCISNIRSRRAVILEGELHLITLLTWPEYIKPILHLYLSLKAKNTKLLIYVDIPIRSACRRVLSDHDAGRPRLHAVSKETLLTILQNTERNQLYIKGYFEIKSVNCMFISSLLPRTHTHKTFFKNIFPMVSPC